MDPAVFFDGQSSRRRVVTLTFVDCLQMVAADEPDGTPLASWPYDAVRRADGPEGALRLACTAATPLARLELRDAAAQAEILRRCGALDGPGSAAAVSVWRIAAASLAAAAAIVAMVWFGMPLLANQLAAVAPYSWETQLGDAVDPRVRTLFGAACEKPAGVAALHKMVARLQAEARLPIAADPAVLRSNISNAFALPGGRIYVLSGLLAKAETPDELAGILAHELGHVVHRDGFRRVIRDGGTSFLVGLLFGDVTGAGAVLMASRAVLSAAYTRTAEESADAFAVTVMHGLGRPTAPMGALLQRIAGPDRDAASSLLRDHPLTSDRKRMFDADDAPAAGPDLLEAAEWQNLKRICDR
jgi:Zn-dependent protease with chaperone function